MHGNPGRMSTILHRPRSLPKANLELRFTLFALTGGPIASQCDNNSVPIMSLRVARGVYNPEKQRFHFYVSFKPTLDPTDDERDVEGSHSVEVAISVTETGELADLAFSLPEHCRSPRSLEYLNRTHSATLIEEKVFITVPGMNGDSVLQGKGTLELDGAGRIMGLEIN